MGVRGELFSTKVSLQNRTYFFNVKENRVGDLYLNIVESKNRDEGGFERQSVILFAEDLQEFLQGFDESLKVLEKAVREKRRGKRPPAAGRETDKETERDYPAEGRDRESRDREGRGRAGPDREGRGSRGKRDYGRSDAPRRPRSPRPDRKSERSFSGDRGDRSDRGGRSGGSRSDGTGRSSRGRQEYRDRDRDSRGGNYRSDEKREFSPRKKRVVVRKDRKD